MAISFIHRLNRLVKADAHGLIESLEDRALLLKQHLREAELELQHKRARLEALTEEERRLREDTKRLEGCARSLDEDATLAIGQGRDDLARFALRRLIPKEKEIAALRSRIDEVAEERARIEERLEGQQSQFEDLRARVRAHLAAQPRASESGDEFGEPIVADEEVEMELLRRQQAEGRAV